MSNLAQSDIGLTGRMSVLNGPLILKLRPQEASSDGQSQLRDVHLVSFFRLGIVNEATPGDEQPPLDGEALITYYLRCWRKASNTDR